MLRAIALLYTCWGLTNIALLTWGFFAFAAHDESKILSLPLQVEKFLAFYLDAVLPFITLGNGMNAWFVANYIPQVGIVIGGIALLLGHKMGYGLLILFILISIAVCVLNYLCYGRERTLAALIPLVLFVATIIYLVRRWNLEK